MHAIKHWCWVIRVVSKSPLRFMKKGLYQVEALTLRWFKCRTENLFCLNIKITGIQQKRGFRLDQLNRDKMVTLVCMTWTNMEIGSLGRHNSSWSLIRQAKHVWKMCSFSSQRKGKLLLQYPIGSTGNGSNRWWLMVTKKRAMMHSGAPDMRAG